MKGEYARKNCVSCRPSKKEAHSDHEISIRAYLDRLLFTILFCSRNGYPKHIRADRTILPCRCLKWFCHNLASIYLRCYISSTGVDPQAQIFVTNRPCQIPLTFFHSMISHPKDASVMKISRRTFSFLISPNLAVLYVIRLSHTAPTDWCKARVFFPDHPYLASIMYIFRHHISGTTNDIYWHFRTCHMERFHAVTCYSRNWK